MGCSPPRRRLVEWMICDFGVVEEVQDEFIVTEKGVINKKRYYLPKILIAGFDGHTLYFRITKPESKRYRHVNTKLQKITKKIEPIKNLF